MSPINPKIDVITVTDATEPTHVVFISCCFLNLRLLMGICFKR